MHSTSTVEPATLLDLVRTLASPASGVSDHPAFTYLDDGKSVSGELTYAELDERARRLAAQIQRRTRKGDRVLLALAPCFEYVIAFYACVYAGVIAVPTVSVANARTLNRLRLMVEDSEPALALTLGAVLRTLDESPGGRDARQTLRNLPWLSVDLPQADHELDPGAEWEVPALSGDDVVFLQYTSGSTGAPKGVRVTHANLLANAQLCRSVYRLRERDVFVSWVPPHHDFGLIGAIVVPVYVRGHSVQFPPAVFLRRPYRWLKLISDFRARVTGAPNFAYQLCVQRVSADEKRNLDLSSLELAINGAERVRAGTVLQFAQTFREAGFAPHAMTPAYGMAESVLLVSANMAKGEGMLPEVRVLDREALDRGLANDAAPQDNTALEAVLTGTELTFDHRIAIVDPEQRMALPDRRVGEIWIQGRSVASGYWGKPEASAETFQAQLPGYSGRWLRSGDLGFVDAGRLYVTGRAKEVMIFGGRNVYPQDVEMTVERLDSAFRANGCAAFSLEEGERTQLVIVQEVQSRRQLNTADLIVRLRAELAERHEIIDLAAVVLVKPGNVPRTSSGKIQRTRCRQLYLRRELDSIWSWTWAQEASEATADAPRGPATATELSLLSIWQEAFGRSDIALTDNFFHLGGHSLQAVQMISAVQAQLHVRLPLQALFRGPTVAAMAREIDLARDQAGAALPRIERSPSGPAALPLSFAQQRFWFLEQYQPGNAFYNMPYVLNIEADVDERVLQRALNALAQRHQPLRSKFRMSAQGVEQVVTENAVVPLTLCDLTREAESSIEARVSEEMAGQVHRPFDLSRAPLLRAVLIRRSPRAHVLLLTVHHIVCDGWSTPVLLKDLAALYASFERNEPPPLAPLPIEFADFVRWEAGHVGGAWLDERCAFWKQYLDGAPTLLDIPTDRPRRGVSRQVGAAAACHLPEPLMRALAAVAGKYDATVFMVMAAAINALLHRMTGQADFCVGVMSASRPQGTEQMIGNFINVVPLRSRVDRSMPFVGLLRANAYDLLLTYDQQIPLELLLRRVASRSGAPHSTPYLQVVLNFHSELAIDPSELQWRGLTASAVSGRQPSDIRHAAFEIKLEIQRAREGFDLVFEYDTDLFDRETIEALAQHYGAVLEAVAANPDSAVGDLALLSEAQRRALLVRSSGTQTSWDGADTLWAAFEAQAERSPDAVAVGFEQEQLSYRELNARANRLAHALRQKGVGADSLVAVCLERSIDMVVSLLAVLKAGGGYVPLDPSYPAERLAYLLEDTSAAALITHAPLAAALGLKHRHMMCVDEERMALAGHPDHNPEPASGAAHLAYCIYTSGSTGQPKGVLNTHGAIMNRLRWMQGEYGLSQKDTVLQKTPFAFDVSVWEFFWPLLNGARLVVAKPDGHKDPAYLAETLRRHRVTIVHFVPSMLQAFLAARPDMTDHALRHVFCSGEALPHPLQEQFHSALASVPLHNLYGPTEAAVDVTYWRCEQEQERGVAAASPVVPIGRPVANTQMYVLDEALDPVPFGVAGDLYIGGVQLARGYLGRPDLTAQKFVPDPFGSAGSRLYMTGDRALCRRDGVIEYLGRSDDQVKLRGLRIELGEIECVLREHEHVQAAAVVACTDGQGEMRLVGYVVAHAGMKPEAAQLRAHLQRRLPEYMVPGTWVWLDALPLSANGKLERKRLPAPDFASRTASAPYVAPRTATEALLASIWAEVLGLERVSIDDDFFELGGHSLLATQVVARLKDRFSYSLSLRALFDSPTIAAISAHLDAGTGFPAGAGGSMPAIQRQKRNSEATQL